MSNSAWLAQEESKYEEDFVEQDSFLILPTRREQVEDVEGALASAAGPNSETPKATSPRNSLQNTNSTPGTSEEAPATVTESDATLTTSKELPKKESSPEFHSLRSFQVVNPQTDALGSLISNISSVSSSGSSLDESNVLISQLNLQSCKEKMAEMTTSATKNLEAYKALQLSITTLREEHQKKYDECGETIRTLRSENRELTRKVEEAQIAQENFEKISAENMQVLEEQVEKSQKKLIEKIEELKSQSIRLEEATQLNNDLKELLRSQKSQMESVDMPSLQEERNALNEAWVASRVAVAKLNEINSAQEQQITQLTQDLDAVNVICAKLKDHGIKKDENIEKLNGALEEAGRRFRQFQSVVAEKETEITNLKTRMVALTSENEQMEIWKHQMQEFKANFEDERHDRTEMSAKLEQMTRDLANANAQLERKTAELESLHKTHIHLASEHLNRVPTPTRISESNKPNSLPQAAANLGRNISKIFQSVIPSQMRDEDASSARGSTAPPEESTGGNGDTSASGGDGSSFESDGPTLGPQNTPPPCPLCFKTFKSVASLQRHASSCGVEEAATRTNPFVF